MNLMISETLLQHTTAATHADVAVDILFHATGECALGRVLVARSVNGVCAILIGAAQQLTAVASDSAAAVNSPTLASISSWVLRPTSRQTSASIAARR